MASGGAGRIGWRAGLLRLVAFVAVNAAGLAAVGVGLERVALELDHNVSKSRSMMSLQGEAYGVLAIGNSVTQQAYDPGEIDQALGVSSFNLASGGQSYVASELILEHYLARNEAPELLVVGTFVNRVSDGAALDPEIYGYLDASGAAHYRERYYEVESRTLPLSYIVFNHIPAYRYRSAIDVGLKYLVAGNDRIMQHRRGFLVSRYHPPGPLKPLGRVEADFDLEGLSRLAEVAGEAGIAVALFEPPSTPGLSELTEGREEVLEQLNALVAREPHILSFRSFNDDQGLDYRFDEWTGRDHLNEAGARRFAREQLAAWTREQLDQARAR